MSNNGDKINLLNHLDETYFFQETEATPIPQRNNQRFHVQHLQEEKITEPKFERELNFLEEVYQNASNKKGQGGYSKSTKSHFIKGFFIHYYRRGGFVITPTYLIFNKNIGFKKVHNMDFKEHHEMMKDILINDPERYKQLSKITFNHVLPDGRIAEYYVEKYNEKTLEKIYCEITELRNKFVLKENLEKQLTQKGESYVKIKSNKI